MTGLTIDLSDKALEQIAERAAELLAERGADDSPAPTVDAWLTTAEAAKYLRCSPSRIYGLVSAGRIPHVKDGSRTLFRRSELDRWLASGGDRCP